MNRSTRHAVLIAALMLLLLAVTKAACAQETQQTLPAYRAAKAYLETQIKFLSYAKEKELVRQIIIAESSTNINAQAAAERWVEDFAALVKVPTSPLHVAGEIGLQQRQARALALSRTPIDQEVVKVVPIIVPCPGSEQPTTKENE